MICPDEEEHSEEVEITALRTDSYRDTTITQPIVRMQDTQTEPKTTRSMHSRHKNVAASFKYDWIDLRKSVSPTVPVADGNLGAKASHRLYGARNSLLEMGGSFQRMRGSITSDKQSMLTTKNDHQSNLHIRLYREHAEHQQRRSSQYDPNRKEKEEAAFMCTFKPSLQKSLSNSYLKTGSISHMVKASVSNCGEPPLKDVCTESGSNLISIQGKPIANRSRSSMRLTGFFKGNSIMEAGNRTQEQFVKDM